MSPEKDRSHARPPSPSVLVQPGMAKPAWRVPADGRTPELAVGDIERAIDEHREPEAGAGPELEHADPALHAVLQRHQPHSGKLRQHACVACHIAA